jgi:hypothetical protein
MPQPEELDPLDAAYLRFLVAELPSEVASILDKLAVKCATAWEAMIVRQLFANASGGDTSAAKFLLQNLAGDRWSGRSRRPKVKPPAEDTEPINPLADLKLVG